MSIHEGLNNVVRLNILTAQEDAQLLEFCVGEGCTI